MNHLNAKVYPHHPVMLAVGLGPYPVHQLYVTEWNGLRVPAGFDCDIFYQVNEQWDADARAVMGVGEIWGRANEPPLETDSACQQWGCTCQGLADAFDTWPYHWGKATDQAKTFWMRWRCNTYPRNSLNPKGYWGPHQYFNEVPSRWFACWLHYADVKSANTLTSPQLPFIDDEYNEQVAVYQSVLRARGTYVVAELGCRWGTWGTRSIAMLRHARPDIIDYTMYLAEADKQNCIGTQKVLKANNMSATLVCDYATHDNFRAWSRTVGHIDLIDMDIQGAEDLMVSKLMDVFNEKV